MMRFFDRMEDEVRGHLSRYPLPYAIIGGVFTVLFWRAIWETAEILSRMNNSLAWFFYAPVQVVFSTLGLMLTGLMVSIFIGERIILSGLRHEKKLEEKTEELVEEEVITLKHLRDEIRSLKKDIADARSTPSQ